MSKKSLLLLSFIFSLSFIPSCHYFSKKKSCCDKKSWSKKVKDCCGKASVAGQAVVQSVSGDKIKGEVFFVSLGKKKIKVTAHFKGLKPNQKFGFHVHEFGICKNKALMAGAHLNPRKAKHGGPQDKEKHLGDLGNLKSDAKGHAAYSAVVKGRLKKFLGRSVIVHAKADDLKSQPTGASGGRIACGVIVASMPPVAVEPKKQKTYSKKAQEKAIEVKKPAQKATQKKVLPKPQAIKKASKPSATAKPQTVQKALRQQAETKKQTVQKLQ